MRPEQLETWRKSMGMSPPMAAKAIGISLSTYFNYTRGSSRGINSTPRPIPRYIALACAALTAGLEPWGEPPPKPKRRRRKAEADVLEAVQ